MLGRFPLFLCHPHEMFGADIAKWRCLAFFRMMETEPTLLHHPARLCVTVIIPAPDGGHPQIFEASLQQATHGFGYQSLPPIRHTYPITYLRLARLHFGTVQTIPEHDSYAPDRLTGFFQNHGVSLWSGKYSPNDVQTVFYRSMRRPSGNRTDSRVLSVFI